MTVRRSSNLRCHLPRIVAATIIVTFYAFARLPGISARERTALAARFLFTARVLPELSGNPPRSVRTVHPSLQHISAWISSVGASVALHDLDGDGLPNDVCFVETRTDQVIVAPAPGTPSRYKPFVLTAAPLPFDPATMAPMGCLPGDFNEDGRADILVYYWGRTPLLFLRRGGILSPSGYVACELMPRLERWYTNTATSADLDGDGHPDLILGNYFPDGARILDARAHQGEQMQDSMSRAFNGGSKRFLLWAGATAGAHPTARFRSVNPGLPAPVMYGWTLALGACDLDGDLLPELYIANDFGPDRLLHNRSTPGHVAFSLLEGKKTLTTPNSKVLGRDSFKGMGVDFADLNGDGLPDIYVSNIAAPYALEESHFLFASTGDVRRMKEGVAPYVDQSEPLGLSRSGWGWDCKLADFDNDRVLEAVQATGFVKGNVNRWPELHELAMGNDQVLRHPDCWLRVQPGDDLSGHQRTAFFVRASDGRYQDIGREIGLREPHVTRGIAVADVDGDGRLDFASANQWESSYLYHNESPRTGAFLGLYLRLPVHAEDLGATHVRIGTPGGEGSDRPAIGAVAAVYLPNGKRLAASVDGGNGHSGRRSPDLHFGLGSLPADTHLRVDVRWRDPNGHLRQDTLSLVPGWHTVVLGWRRG